MFIKLSICMLMLSINLPGYSQSDLNYSPKQLLKEFSKYAKTETINYKEIPHPQNINYAGKFFKIQNAIPDFPYNYIYIGRVNTCRAGGCSDKAKNKDEGVDEYFDYYILYDQTLSVKLVKVFDYQASHGQEMTSVGWLKQFIGYSNMKTLRVGKEVDAISGATISVNAITDDIKLKSAILKKIIL